MSKNNSGQISPPTLLGPIPTHATPSMLSSLDEGASNPRKGKRGRSPIWFAGLALLVTGLVTGGGVMIANTVTATVKPANVPVSNVVTKPVPKTASMASTGNPPEEIASSQAAMIISDQTPPAQKTEVPSKSSNNPHDRLSAALEGSPLIPQAKYKQNSGTQTTVKTRTTTKNKTEKIATKEKPIHQNSQKSKSNHSHSSDNDVKLLAALVASTNQDIVERKPGESTASLLKRCKKLGSLEGSLCSERICSGHWKNDPDCAAHEKSKETSADNKDK